jgi:hypothetical protein
MRAGAMVNALHEAVTAAAPLSLASDVHRQT